MHMGKPDSIEAELKASWIQKSEVPSRQEEGRGQPNCPFTRLATVLARVLGWQRLFPTMKP
jgi:hypothetical protein